MDALGVSNSNAMRILLVEDSDDLAEAIITRLTHEGHAIDREIDGQVAADLLSWSAFDLVLLDINLPGLSGFEVLKSMRNNKNDTPVLVLTARSEIDDRIVGLDAGADDYMVKPFDFRELAARCRALGRRQGGDSANEFRAGSFVYDRHARAAYLAGRDLSLRNREVQLLEAFLARQGRILTKEELADVIYTFDEVPTLNAVEQTVTRLRKKLEGGPLLIKTVRGLGYIANIDEAAAHDH